MRSECVALQLLDLMHTLHTKAALIYNSWAQESNIPDATAVAEDAEQVAEQSHRIPADDTEAGTSALWTHCWCPLLQGFIVFVLSA